MGGFEPPQSSLHTLFFSVCISRVERDNLITLNCKLPCNFIFLQPPTLQPVGFKLVDLSITPTM